MSEADLTLILRQVVALLACNEPDAALVALYATIEQLEIGPPASSEEEDYQQPCSALCYTDNSVPF
jgi:hypothetical protein